MNRLTRHLRLLPAVVIVGTGLLVLKGVDIARAAQSATTVDPDQADNSGLAPTDTAARTGPDYAEDETTLGSPAEADVQSSLTHRRAELDARERALDMRENVLNAGEGRVDQKIAALKDLQAQIQTLLTQRDAAQDAQIASLVKTYSTMKAKDAARIFEQLGDDVLIPVAKGMKSDVLAPILASMNPDAAQKLTVKLAALLKLPETSPAICPTPPVTADATTPVPTATTPAPLQTAALTPPPALSTPPAATPAPTPPPAPAPHKPASHHVTPAKPATANTTPPPKPATANATPPVTTPKPTTTAATTPAPTPTPAKPPAQAASAPPTTLTPPAGG